MAYVVRKYRSVRVLLAVAASLLMAVLVGAGFHTTAPKTSLLGSDKSIGLSVNAPVSAVAAPAAADKLAPAQGLTQDPAAQPAVVSGISPLDKALRSMAEAGKSNAANTNSNVTDQANTNATSNSQAPAVVKAGNSDTNSVQPNNQDNAK